MSNTNDESSKTQKKRTTKPKKVGKKEVVEEKSFELLCNENDVKTVNNIPNKTVVNNINVSDDEHNNVNNVQNNNSDNDDNVQNNNQSDNESNTPAIVPQSGKTYSRNNIHNDNRQYKNDRNNRYNNERNYRQNNYRQNNNPNNRYHNEKKKHIYTPNKHAHNSCLDFSFDECISENNDKTMGECDIETHIMYLISLTYKGGLQKKALCNVLKNTLTGMNGETNLPLLTSNETDRRIPIVQDIGRPARSTSVRHHSRYED
jgi:hypothetical protein